MGASVEELVYTETEDGVQLEGAVIRPSPGPAKPLAVVWIHGNAIRFYVPSIVHIGRMLAERGHLFVTGNTRGHDVGTFVRMASGSVLGGAAWERFEESPHDLAAWIALAAAEGRRVALVGHSLGGTKAAYYQALRQDPRVAGVALASSGGGAARSWSLDPALVALAERMAAQGRGHELLPWGSVPGGLVPTVSAQTYLSRAASLPDLSGDGARPPAVGRIRCPLFACCGTNDPLIADATALLDAIRGSATAAARVDTVVLEGVNHGYQGHEAAVAAAMAPWFESLT